MPIILSDGGQMEFLRTTALFRLECQRNVVAQVVLMEEFLRLTSLCLAAAAVFPSVSRAQPPVLRHEKQVNYDSDQDT